MKTKKHEFKLTVKSGFSRRETWLAMLSAFASRKPDGCRVSLRLSKPNAKRRKKARTGSRKIGFF